MTQSISPMVAFVVTISAMARSAHASPMWVADKRAAPEESAPAESKAEPKASETHKEEAKPSASSNDKPSASKAEPKETDHTKASATHKETHASTTTKKAASTSTEKEKKTDASPSNPFTFNGVSPIGASHHETAASPTSTNNFVDQGNSSGNESSGMSSGAVAGIVIAILVAVAGIIGFVLVRKKKKAAAVSRSRMNPDPFTMGFGNNDPPPFNNNNSNYPPHTAYTANQSPMIQLPPIGASAQQSPMVAPTSTYSPAINHYNSEVNHYNNTAASSAAQSMPSPEYHNAPSPVPTPVVVSAPQESPQPAAAQAKSLGIFPVVSTYTPTLSDELDIQPGDRVDVLTEYDDGWCQGVNLSRGNCKGVFPKHCVDFYGGESHQQQQVDSNKYDASNMKRVSSMLGNPQQQSPYYL